MSRRPLHAALSLALTWTSWANWNWASTCFAQSPTPSAQAQPMRTLTVAEPGRPPEKCALLQVWQLEDGSPAMKVQSLATGEIMTVVDPVNSTATKDRFRVYRWGKSVTPPPNTPAPPEAAKVEVQKEEPEPAPAQPERKWPSAHETAVKPSKQSTKEPSASSARQKPAASMESKPSRQAPAVTKPRLELLSREAASRARELAEIPAKETPAKNEARLPATSVAGVSDPGQSPAAFKAEPPAKLAAAAPAMDRNPAVPASVPVAPPPPPVPEVKSPEPVKVSSAATPRLPSETAAKETAAKSENRKSAVVAATSTAPVLPPPLPGEPEAVSRTRPATSVAPDEPPTPIVQATSTQRRTSPSDKEAKNQKPDSETPIDNGHIVSRPAPALPATAIRVVPRRSGPDPLANPDQYVRLKKDKEMGEEKPRQESTAVKPVAVPEAPVAVKADQSKAESSPTTSVARVTPPMGPPKIEMPATESTEPKAVIEVHAPATNASRAPQVVQASVAEKEEPAPEPIDPPSPVALPEPPAPPPPPEPTFISVAPVPSVSPAEKTKAPEPVKAASLSAPTPPQTPANASARPSTQPSVAQTPKAVAAPTRSSARPVAAESSPAPETKAQTALAAAPDSDTLPSSVPQLEAPRTALPVVQKEARHATLAVPAAALPVKPLPSVDVSSLQGMVDLMKVLSDSGVPAHRQQAASDLGAVDARRHPYVVEALTSAVKKDGAALVRVAAIKSLTQMRADSATVKAAFQAAAADADPRVRDAAAEALRTFPASAQPEIMPVTGFSR
jgi:hypothetical protein